jgi:large subunit ribosomal protein L29
VNRKASDLRDLSDVELVNKLNEAHREMFNLRFQHFTRQLANYKRLEQVRHDIARIKTILHERELEIQR